VPVNEKNGRRHSSEIRVVIFDDPATMGERTSSVRVDPAQVRLDTFRSSGAGGQHRNKTDSGVRLLHFPTGIVVTATEERSQHQNRAVAWERLRRALESRSQQAHHDDLNQVRNSALSEPRAWTWTGWRDEVKGPNGQKASMSRVLSGRWGLVL
jgi:protein subunit release factor A